MAIKIYVVVDKARDVQQTGYTTLEKAKYGVETMHGGQKGTWIESDSHGEIHRFYPFDEKRFTYYIEPVNVW